MHYCNPPIADCCYPPVEVMHLKTAGVRVDVTWVQAEEKALNEFRSRLLHLAMAMAVMLHNSTTSAVAVQVIR